MYKMGVIYRNYFYIMHIVSTCCNLGVSFISKTKTKIVLNVSIQEQNEKSLN